MRGEVIHMVEVSLKEVFNNVIEHTGSADNIVIKFDSAGGCSRAAKAGLSGHTVIDMGNGVYVIREKEYERGIYIYEDYTVTSDYPMKIIGKGGGVYINTIKLVEVYFGDAYVEITKGLFNGIYGTAFHFDRPDRVTCSTDMSNAFSHLFDVSLDIREVCDSRSINADNLFANCDSISRVNVTDCSFDDISLERCFENNHTDGINLIEIKQSQIGISRCKDIFSSANVCSMTLDKSKIDIRCDSRYLVNATKNGQIDELSISNCTINLNIDSEYKHINSDIPFYVEFLAINDTTITNIEAFKNMLRYTYIGEVVTNVPEIQKAIDDVKKELTEKFSDCDDDDLAGEYVKYLNNK